MTIPTSVEYFSDRPNRWVEVYTEVDSDHGVSGVHWEGWLRATDDHGVVIFGRPMPSIFSIADVPGSNPSKPKDDSTFIPWSRISLIRMDQDKEKPQ